MFGVWPWSGCSDTPAKSVMAWVSYYPAASVCITVFTCIWSFCQNINSYIQQMVWTCNASITYIYHSGCWEWWRWRRNTTFTSWCEEVWIPVFRLCVSLQQLGTEGDNWRRSGKLVVLSPFFLNFLSFHPHIILHFFSGAFGKVYSGILNDPERDMHMKVAIKTVKRKLGLH